MELRTGQCQVGSLTGAVASQRVTEAPKDTLSMDGNHAQSAKAKGCLTARQTSRAGTKVGLSDPAAPNGRAVAQRIKATLDVYKRQDDDDDDDDVPAFLRNRKL